LIDNHSFVMKVVEEKKAFICGMDGFAGL
jgi:hypothetical protein